MHIVLLQNKNSTDSSLLYKNSEAVFFCNYNNENLRHFSIIFDERISFTNQTLTVIFYRKKHLLRTKF